MKSPSRVLPVALAVLACSAAPAAAAPVTVNLRVEGATSTLFDGPVTTDVRPWRFSDNPAEYECDGTPESNNGGTSATPVPTRGAVLAAAAQQHGFSVKGTFNADWGSPTITEVAGENVGWDNASQRYLVEFLNGRGTDLGACAEPVSSGDEVLFGYAPYGATALRVSGPATAKPGQPVTLRVADGSGAAVAGATVAGATTDGAGNAAVTFTARGPQTVKADKAGAVRSAGFAVCVSDGADGYCGNPTPSGQLIGGGTTTTAPDRDAPRATVSGLANGRTLTRAKAPQVLRGTVAESGGVLMVKLRLLREHKGRCWAYSAKRERWIRRPRCSASQAWWFKVGDKPQWEYQLARKLPAGRYTLDVNAIDRAYNRDDARRPGKNRVVFTVR